MVQRYTKKPVTIEAIKYTGTPESKREIIDWTRGSETAAFVDKSQDTPEELFINTLEGTHKATVGDFVIRGIKGEHYFCKPDIFEATYALAE